EMPKAARGEVPYIAYERVARINEFLSLGHTREEQAHILQLLKRIGGKEYWREVFESNPPRRIYQNAQSQPNAMMASPQGQYSMAAQVQQFYSMWQQHGQLPGQVAAQVPQTSTGSHYRYGESTPARRPPRQRYYARQQTPQAAGPASQQSSSSQPQAQPQAQPIPQPLAPREHAQALMSPQAIRQQQQQHMQIMQHQERLDREERQRTEQHDEWAWHRRHYHTNGNGAPKSPMTRRRITERAYRKFSHLADRIPRPLTREEFTQALLTSLETGRRDRERAGQR
ncbi:hypothetical protein KEM55_007984, partial [Ascosphaera atra]